MGEMELSSRRGTGRIVEVTTCFRCDVFPVHAMSAS